MRRKIFTLCFIIILSAIFINVQAYAEDDIVKLKEHIINVQNKNKLGIRNLYICDNIRGYGNYDPRPTNVVKSNSKVLFYYEPANVYTKIYKDKNNRGIYEIWYTQDMIVLTAKGKVLLNKQDALSFHYISRSPVLDLYATNTLTISNLPKGKYIYRIRIKDKQKNQIAQKDIYFIVN